MMDGAELQPPQTIEPADLTAWVFAELVMQPLSGLEMVQAGWPRVEAPSLNPGASTLG